MNLNWDEINSFRAKTDPSKGGHVARLEAHIQSIKRENISIGREISHFLIFLSIEREREGEREEGFLQRFTGFRRLEFVGPRTKVHCLNEGYAWVSKRRDFTEDP